MTRRRPLLSLLVLLALLSTAPSLRAESAPEAASVVQRAEQLFRRGTEAFEAGQYADAYGSLRAAWDLAPDYRSAAGLGQVELRLSQYRDAAEHLAYCLRYFPPSGDPSARQHVEEGLEQAREHVAALRVRVDPEGADVAIDGQSVGHAPLEGLVFVTPGRHAVRATAGGREAATETVDAPVRVTRDVVLSLAATTGAPRAAGAASASSASSVAGAGGATDSPGAARSPGAISDTAWAVIIGGSLTAVAIGTAVLFDVNGASAGTSAEDLRLRIGSGGSCAAPSPPQVPLCAELRDDTDARNRDDRIALVAAIGAGVLGAATVGTAIFLESRSPARASARGGLSVHAALMPGAAALVVGGAL